MYIKRKIALAVFAAAAAMLAACGANPPATPTTQTTVADKMPTTAKPMPPVSVPNEKAGEPRLAWRLVDGTTERLADFRGKAVILDFWATYCPPCEEGIPHLVELSQKYNRDLIVVGLHVGGDADKQNVAEFVGKYRMTYKLGYPEQALQNFYLQGDDRIPQTLVFDRSGRLVRQFVGFTPEIKADLDAAVQQAMN